MSQYQMVSDASQDQRLASAAENFERIRRVIGPYMPSRRVEEVPRASDWRSSDMQEDSCVKQSK